MEEFIRVTCIALPIGEVLWCESERGHEYIEQVVDKWISEHPELDDSCSVGVVEITMPRDKYIAIGAEVGPGCFEWPADKE